MGSGSTTGGIAPEGVADFINGSPEESDYALIGRIALQQTALEYQIEALIWHYVGDIDLGHIATAKLGNAARTDMLSTIVEWIEPDDGIAEAIEWAIKCFHILRDNRNSIIHGFNFRADRRAGKLIIERRTKSLVFDAFQVFEINRVVLHQVSNDQVSTSIYLWRLREIIERRPAGAIGPNLPPPSEPARLPSKPPLPAPLVSLPHEAPKSARHQRREFAATNAKRLKEERKARQRMDPKNRKKGE